MNKKQIEFLENNFNVYKDDNNWGLEDWTDGGVNMFIYININKDIPEQLEEYLKRFDIDEEIDVYRQSKDYRDAFTIRESVKDFESWERKIRTIINVLKEVK